jgi:signal transduction histidine kinase
VPLALAWRHPPTRAEWRGRLPEAAAMLVAVVGLTELALRGARPLTYIAFPGLIWAALRFGQRGATLAIAIFVGLTVWNTTNADGAFYFHSITRSVLSTQLFIAVAAISTLSLAAVVTEREEIAVRLRSSRARLSGTADAERRRIERNLHDGAQQRLVALAMRLELASGSVLRAPDTASGVLDDATGELQQAIVELRELAQGIHPSVLTNLGLADAIESLTAHGPTNVAVVAAPAGRFNERAEATAYYVATEAIANAQKHARASSIRVDIRAVPGALVVEVLDDGAGGAVERGGGGLQGLRDREEAGGGTLSIDSPAEHGTTVLARIPATPRGDP